MHAVHFLGQESGLPVGRECDRKREYAKGRKHKNNEIKMF